MRTLLAGSISFLVLAGLAYSLAAPSPLATENPVDAVGTQIAQATPPNDPQSQDDEDVLQQAIYNLKRYAWVKPIGDFAPAEIDGVTHHYPVGNGEHYVRYKLKGENGIVSQKPVPLTGEIIVTKHAVFVDFVATDRIVFKRSDQDLGLNPAVGQGAALPCDGVYSNVNHTSFTGTCWGLTVANPETGVWTKPCNQSPPKSACKAEVVFSNGTDPKNINFGCPGPSSAGPTNGMDGNSSTGTANAYGAQSGC